MDCTPLNLWGANGDDRVRDGADFFVEIKRKGRSFNPLVPTLGGPHVGPTLRYTR